MMMSVYLHQYVADILRCFGDLDTAINKVLQACVENNIELTDKPQCPERTGSVRYDVDIVNDEYLALSALYPATSPKISLRRLLYWFVDNEMYTELDWTATNAYQDTVREKIGKKVNKVYADLNSLCRILTDDECLIVKAAMAELEKLK